MHRSNHGCYIAICMALAMLLQFNLSAQEEPTLEERLQWFADAKLGIFIHWGIYAVNGIDESWSFYNEYISHEDYMKQLQGFTAKRYNPEEWASLFRQSGAKYAVLTSKHHDGVALWDSKKSDLNVVAKTPAGRDLIQPFADELRKQDLKVGLYYSLLDWSHPHYPNFTRSQKRYTDDTDRWDRFVSYNLGQIEEIQELYNPDLFWFDGDWEQSAEKWQAEKIRRMVLEHNPQAIINSRLQGYGDYATPEQGVPVLQPEEPLWELCMTMNDSWGFQPNDRDYKSPNQVIRIFADCLSMGGNLLLDIGPREDGTIPDEQVNILEELGRWTRKHAEAIYGSKAGIPRNYFAGPSTISADRKVLYLFIEHVPIGPLLVKGLENRVERIRVVGNGTKLNWDIKMKLSWSPIPGLLYIDLPGDLLDEQVTVVAIQLDGEVNLYQPEK